MSNSTGPIGANPGMSIPSATTTGVPEQPAQKRARASGELKQDGLPSRGPGTPMQGSERPPRKSFVSRNTGAAPGGPPSMPQGSPMSVHAFNPLNDQLIADGNRVTQENIRLMEAQGKNAEAMGQAQFMLSLQESAAKTAKSSGDVLKNAS